jgi:KDO2-lipid IV(A) lauroyltransferase
MADRGAMTRRLRPLAYPFEALGAALLLGLFRIMPTGIASAVGGWLGRTIGPLLPVSRRALRNLALAMPELDEDRRKAILRAMWDNVGRILGEYPHIGAIARDAGVGGRVEVTGLEHVAGLRDRKLACIMVSGHLANWEVFAQSCASVGMGYAQIYRAANNPIVDSLLKSLRGLPDDAIMPKGPAGARRALTILKEGGRIGALVDQKMNDGIEAPFFGRPAMSPPAAAQLALRFGCPLIPVRMERLGGCRFRMSFHAPLPHPDTGDRAADIAALTGAANRILEAWIRERPAEWLWLHRRWPES